jgi:hypothetical protein
LKLKGQKLISEHLKVDKQTAKISLDIASLPLVLKDDFKNLNWHFKLSKINKK